MHLIANNDNILVPFPLKSLRHPSNNQFPIGRGRVILLNRDCQSLSLSRPFDFSSVNLVPKAFTINGPPSHQVRSEFCRSISHSTSVTSPPNPLNSKTVIELVSPSKRGRRFKSVEDILKLPKSKSRGGRKKQKCIVYRSAIAATALSVASISSGGIKNRNRIILNEEEAVWTVTKIIGEDYLGNDEEVFSKIMVADSLEGFGRCPLDTHLSS